MDFDKDEINNLKETLLYLIEKKDLQSNGHCGFHLKELEPLIEQLLKENKIEVRPTINSRMYFLKK